MLYNSLCEKAAAMGLWVETCPLPCGAKGLYTALKGLAPRILLAQSLSLRDKNVALAVQLGLHACPVAPAKKDLRMEAARQWAAEAICPPEKIILGVRNGAATCETLAEYLEISVSFLRWALQYFAGKYEPYACHNGWLLFFNPLGVTSWLEDKNG